MDKFNNVIPFVCDCVTLHSARSRNIPEASRSSAVFRLRTAYAARKYSGSYMSCTMQRNRTRHPLGRWWRGVELRDGTWGHNGGCQSNPHHRVRTATLRHNHPPEDTTGAPVKPPAQGTDSYPQAQSPSWRHNGGTSQTPQHRVRTATLRHNHPPEDTTGAPVKPPSTGYGQLPSGTITLLKTQRGHQPNPHCGVGSTITLTHLFSRTLVQSNAKLCLHYLSCSIAVGNFLVKVFFHFLYVIFNTRRSFWKHVRLIIHDSQTSAAFANWQWQSFLYRKCIIISAAD